MGFKIINIVGNGNGMELAPTTDCWGINSVIFERYIDLHFDMHSKYKLKPHQAERREKVIEKANALNIPVYACEEIPGTTYIRYPIEKVIREFKTGYFSNGVCYMIALAILEGVKKINFYGINHSRINLDEYTIQKPGVDYWLGICHERKVEYEVHGHWSEIGKTWDGLSYGYNITQDSLVKQYG